MVISSRLEEIAHLASMPFRLGDGRECRVLAFALLAMAIVMAGALRSVAYCSRIRTPNAGRHSKNMPATPAAKT
ncbi:MAG UNVERIFIED_CONTAM: hypothetical protein LVR18_19175 [Planctomycetaceae bacterium]|jgi:hypothetical protein